MAGEPARPQPPGDDPPPLAGRPAVSDTAGDPPRDDPLVDTAVRQAVAGVDEDHPFGRPGRPVGEQSWFRLALIASIGVGLALELLRAVVDVREILLLAAVALVLAIGLEQAVVVLSRRLPRSVAVSLVVTAFLALFIGFLAAALPPLTTQTLDLLHRAPSYFARLTAHNATLRHLDARYHLVSDLRRHVSSGRTLGLAAVGGVVGVGRALLSAGIAIVTVVVLLVYFLANFPALKRSAYRLVPRSRRPRVGLVADEVLARVGTYIIGNLATSVIAGLAAGIYLAIAGVPYPIALGLFVAITDLIPLVGAIVGALVTCVVAFFVSAPIGIATVAFFVLYQLLQNLVITRRLIPREVRLTALSTLLSAAIGGAVFGVVGIIVAIPLTAGARLLLGEVVYPRQDRR